MLGLARGTAASHTHPWMQCLQAGAVGRQRGYLAAEAAQARPAASLGGTRGGSRGSCSCS
jgi:hypothetical protein